MWHLQNRVYHHRQLSCDGRRFLACPAIAQCSQSFHCGNQAATRLHARECLADVRKVRRADMHTGHRYLREYRMTVQQQHRWRLRWRGRIRIRIQPAGRRVQSADPITTRSMNFRRSLPRLIASTSPECKISPLVFSCTSPAYVFFESLLRNINGKIGRPVARLSLAVARLEAASLKRQQGLSTFAR